MKKIFTKLFNRPDTLVVISTYPPRAQVHGDKVGGVASFTKNTLRPLANVKSGKIVVLADKIGKEEIYQEDGMLIYRCWDRNSLALYAQLFRALIRFSKAKVVLSQFEFALYGDFLITSFFPIFQILLRILGIKNILVLHQVIVDLTSLSGHIGMRKNSFLLRGFSLLMRLFYKLLGLGSTKIVVLESEFKSRLQKIGIPDRKIAIIPHGVDCKITKVHRKTALAKLSIDEKEVVFLCFGFLTWYKGSDLAVKAFSRFKKRYPKARARLILAGGRSLTQDKKYHYQRYADKLTHLVQRTKNADITGYVKEEDFATYFAASDVVILPYRAFMSSSGILSLALSYARPIAMSSTLKKWFGAEDTQQMKKLAFFEPSVGSLTKEFCRLYKKPHIRLQSKDVVEKLRRGRDFEKLAYVYNAIIEEATQAKTVERGIIYEA